MFLYAQMYHIFTINKIISLSNLPTLFGLISIPCRDPKGPSEPLWFRRTNLIYPHFSCHRERLTFVRNLIQKTRKRLGPSTRHNHKRQLTLCPCDEEGCPLGLQYWGLVPPHWGHVTRGRQHFLRWWRFYFWDEADLPRDAMTESRESPTGFVIRYSPESLRSFPIPLW